MNADTFLSHLSMFSSCQLLGDPNMTEVKAFKRNVFMRIIAKIFKLPKFRTETVPSDKLYCLGDYIIAHPEMIKKLEQAIKAQEKSCQLLR